MHGRVIWAGTSSLQLLSTPPPGLLDDPMIPGRGCTPRQPRASLRLVSLVELRKPPKAREQRSSLRGVAVVRFAPQPVVLQARTGGDAAVWIRLEPRMHNMMMIRSSVSVITSRVEKQCVAVLLLWLPTPVSPAVGEGCTTPFTLLCTSAALQHANRMLSRYTIITFVIHIVLRLQTCVD